MKTVLVAVAVWCCGCSRSNNLLLGRVEANVGAHKVVVTDSRVWSTRWLGVVVVAVVVWCCGCSRSNNLLLGRVEANVGAHRVVVTDCYRTSVPAPEKVSDTEWHYAPCRDAEVWIRKDELEVNGRGYGKIRARDTVVVDHGVVSVKGE